MLLVSRNWCVSKFLKFLFLDGFVDPVAKLAEKVLVSPSCLWRGGTFKKQAPQVLPVLIFADQLADILAGGAVATCANLIVQEGLERLRKRYVDTSHGVRLPPSSIFGKVQLELP